MAQSIFISQSAWEQLGSAHTHRAWLLATAPKATPGAFSFYPHGKAPPIAVNIAKLPELPGKS
jgi:hypothetical protein